MIIHDVMRGICDGLGEGACGGAGGHCAADQGALLPQDRREGLGWLKPVELCVGRREGRLVDQRHRVQGLGEPLHRPAVAPAQGRQRFGEIAVPEAVEQVFLAWHPEALRIREREPRRLTGVERRGPGGFLCRPGRVPGAARRADEVAGDRVVGGVRGEIVVGGLAVGGQAGQDLGAQLTIDDEASW